MREFTPEEKELIKYITARLIFAHQFDKSYKITKNAEEAENIRFNKSLAFLRELCPCAERKDICKEKHQVPETPHFGKESRAVPCYEMYNCYSCGLFKK